MYIAGFQTFFWRCKFFKNKKLWGDFPGGLAVKTVCFRGRGVGLTFIRGCRPHMLCGKKMQKKNKQKKTNHRGAEEIKSIEYGNIGQILV